jgi:hypothetical protein
VVIYSIVVDLTAESTGCRMIIARLRLQDFIKKKKKKLQDDYLFFYFFAECCRMIIDSVTVLVEVIFMMQCYFHIQHSCSPCLIFILFFVS